MKQILLIVNPQESFINLNDNTINTLPNIIKLVKSFNNTDQIYVYTENDKKDPINPYLQTVLNTKNTEYYKEYNLLTLATDIDYYANKSDEINIIGYFTDQNVLSAALILKQQLPKNKIVVHEFCCNTRNKSTQLAALMLLHNNGIKIS